jgi:hypothetical protein
MSVEAEVEFLSKRTERPIYYASSAGRNAKHDIDQPMNIVTVNIEDARVRSDQQAPREFGQHPSGFDLLKFETRVDNFLDQGQIESVYEGEIIDFLKRVTGGYRVHIFDHTVRASDPDLREQKNVREPATLVHNDYTSTSGFVCLQENLGADADELARGRFQIINVWRPLTDPVEDYPLALVDSRTTSVKFSSHCMIQSSAGFIFQRCVLTKCCCSRPSIRSTAARIPATSIPRSTWRMRRLTQNRARASKHVPSCSITSDDRSICKNAGTD